MGLFKVFSVFVGTAVILLLAVTTTQGHSHKSCQCKAWTNWSAWSKCSAGSRCNYQGQQYRSRSCQQAYKYSKCGARQYEKRSCKGQCIGCSCYQWNAWGQWSACTAGNRCNYLGKQYRKRTCKSSNCNAHQSQSKSCRGSCSRWGAWGSWSACTKACGGGKRTRRRSCQGGTGCPGSSTQSGPCNTHPCCRNGHVKVDACERQCTCRSGKYYCVRIRKDFPSMTIIERKRYIYAVRRISTVAPYKAQYEALIKTHMDLFSTSIHQMEDFLPWHRWFILQYENLLRKVSCKITVPYWDWSFFSNNAWDTRPPNSVWNAYHGLGGNGASSDRCVTTGIFRKNYWKLTRHAGSGCLRRNFRGKPPDRVAVNLVLGYKDFQTFENALRVTLHDVVHCMIGGVMCERISAEAPEFFLHHGFIDKLWADWQYTGSQSEIMAKNKYFLNSVKAMPGTNGLRPKSFVNLMSQPGYVRVKYKNPTHNNIGVEMTAMKAMTMNTLRLVGRLGYTYFLRVDHLNRDATLSEQISFSVIKLFRLSSSQCTAAVTIQKWLKPRSLLTYEQYVRMSVFERMQGFKFISNREKIVTGYCPCREEEDKKKREDMPVAACSRDLTTVTENDSPEL